MGMIYLSEEDISVTAVVSAWLQHQQQLAGGDAKMINRLAVWIEELFHKTLDWVGMANADVVPTTKVK